MEEFCESILPEVKKIKINILSLKLWPTLNLSNKIRKILIPRLRPLLKRRVVLLSPRKLIASQWCRETGFQPGDEVPGNKDRPQFQILRRQLAFFIYRLQVHDPGPRGSDLVA